MSLPSLIQSPADMAAWSQSMHAKGERIALVPTMGFLHQGHQSLLREGKARASKLVMSLFVNPTQFGPTEDLERYPRDLEGDLAKAASEGTDVVFAPQPASMYPPGYETYVQLEKVTQGLCGDLRPQHFRGVATVVAKLFNIVRPHIAVFGEKDFQQLAVIRRMTADLNMGIEIIGQPTVREQDGLALSSRNKYLSEAERERAACLSRALRAAVTLSEQGELAAATLHARALTELTGRVDRLEYLEIRNADNLQPLEIINRPAVMLVAAYLGNTRLIDNMRLGFPQATIVSS